MSLENFPINGGVINGSAEEAAAAAPYQSDINEVVLSRLTEQFKNKGNIEKLIRTYLEGLGEVRGTNNDLLYLRNLYTAAGVSLDVVGAQIGVQRLGRSDIDYRVAIFIATAITGSEGTRDDCIRVCRLHSAGSKLRYWDIFPAAFQLFTDGESASLDTTEFVRAVTPAGINSETTVIASHGNEPFVLTEVLFLDPTLALENSDDYISETGELLELNVPGAGNQPVTYGGGFGESIDTGGASDDYVLDITNDPYGFPLSEVYQS